MAVRPGGPPVFRRVPSSAEALLLGGAVANVGRVYRVGNTVRRPVAPHRARTHAVLDHLADVGFTGSPRLLAADPTTESLSWIPGQAARSPLPEWALGVPLLVSVARLVRGFHLAVRSFPVSDGNWPVPVPPAYRGPLVSHNDLHPGNIICRDGAAVGLIDFDLASPGSAIWDLATVLRCWAPLVSDADLPNPLRAGATGQVDDVRFERAALLLDAYGLAEPERLAVVDALVDNHDWTYRIVTDAAADGHQGFGDYWDAVSRQTARARSWLVDNLPTLRSALG